MTAQRQRRQQQAAASAWDAAVAATDAQAQHRLAQHDSQPLDLPTEPLSKPAKLPTGLPCMLATSWNMATKRPAGNLADVNEPEKDRSLNQIVTREAKRPRLGSEDVTDVEELD